MSAPRTLPPHPAAVGLPSPEDCPIERAADRQAARDANLGRWARRHPETVDLTDTGDSGVIPVPEAVSAPSGTVWLRMGVALS